MQPLSIRLARNPGYAFDVGVEHHGHPLILGAFRGADRRLAPSKLGVCRCSCGLPLTSSQLFQLAPQRLPVMAVGNSLAILLLPKGRLQCFLVALNHKTKEIAPSHCAFADEAMLARNLNEDLR